MSTSKPARMRRVATRYFGLVRNLTTGATTWRGPIGLASLSEADERMPMLPANAQPGHVVLRRMTRCAAHDLTHPVEALRLDEDAGKEIRCKVDFICGDLPTHDHYYTVR